MDCSAGCLRGQSYEVFLYLKSFRGVFSDFFANFVGSCLSAPCMLRFPMVVGAGGVIVLILIFRICFQELLKRLPA